MNVERLAYDFGRSLAKTAGDGEPGSSLPVAMGLGAVAGGIVGANRNNIVEHAMRDPDVSRIVEALRGIAQRMDGKIKAHPVAASAVAGAGIAGAGVLGAYGLKKIYDMHQERERLRGQAGAFGQQQY